MQSTPIVSESGYSPPLHIQLTLHGSQYEVASIGPDALVLRDARAAEPGPAVVRVSIDGQPILYHIDLIDGIDPARQKQTFRRRAVIKEVAA